MSKLRYGKLNVYILVRGTLVRRNLPTLVPRIRLFMPVWQSLMVHPLKLYVLVTLHLVPPNVTFTLLYL